MLLKIVKSGIILSFFTPLVLGPFGLTFSAYPKAVFFRTAIDLAFIFYLLLVYLNKKYLPKLSPLVGAVLIFQTILVISSLLGINPARSFLGTFDRGEGVILHLHLLLFFLIIIGIFKTKKEWFTLLKLAFIVSALSSFAGLLQKLGIFGVYGNSLSANGIGGGRMSGTLANPDFFGAYMTLSIFLGLFILLFEKEKDYKILWGIIVALDVYTLILSQTRAAWFGLIFGVLIILVLLASKYSSIAAKKRKIILFCVLILSIFSFFIIFNYQKIGLDRHYLFQRFVSSFNITNSSRFMVWKIAVKSWQSAPILGHGPESFGYFYDKYFHASYLPYTGEIYFDYPHNKYLGILSDSGLVGLFSFLSIFAVAFYLIFKKKETNYAKKNTLFVLAAFLFAYLIQNIFAFDTIAIYFILFLVLGFLNNNFEKSLNVFSESGKKEKTKILKYSEIGLVSALILASLIFIYKINIKPTLASMDLVAALRMNSSNESFEDVLSLLKKSVVAKTAYD